MLHELLLALSGVSGSIFVDKKELGIQVVGELPFLHPSETEILNHLCKLGSYVKQFENFVKSYSILLPRILTNDTTDNSPSGLYLQALCTGLDQLLDTYRKTLLDLENEILRDANIPLTRIQHRLEEFQLLFPALSNMLEEVQIKKAKGCLVLDILHSHCSNGIPIVKKAFESILHVCHGVMYKQLGAWLLRGLLLDNFGEFFIMARTSANVQAIVAQHGESKSENDDKTGGEIVKNKKENNQGSQKAKESQFCLNAQMLPSYISTSVAEKILFVGESVKMLASARTKYSENHADDVMSHSELEFGQSLHRLQQETVFHLPTFEKEIDRIKARIAEHLWYLVVEEGELLKHIKLLKDFYLLGRGEVFRSLIEKSKDLLKTPPNANTSHHIKIVFDEIMRTLLPDEDENTSNFVLSVETGRSQLSADENVVTGWNSIKLSYDVRWPLHIVFTTNFLEKFNGLFRFLINVRRTQMELQNVWVMYKGSKALQKAISTDIWLLRMEMTFLIDNLQYYLQVDVLETQYSILLEKINSTKDFETLRLAHDHFITTLLAQSFLLMRPVSHCLNEIMDLCLSFCTLLSHSHSELSERELIQIENIKKNYSRQSSLLLKLFSGVRSHQASPHLAQFLLRIDFNKYFSTLSQTTTR